MGGSVTSCLANPSFNSSTRPSPADVPERIVHMTAVIRAYAPLFVLAAVIAAPSANAEESAKRIALSGDRAYPESIAAARLIA
jgi:hypothetical protein